MQNHAVRFMERRSDYTGRICSPVGVKGKLFRCNVLGMTMVASVLHLHTYTSFARSM